MPDSIKRAMARHAEAEREKRAKIINAQGESLAAAADPVSAEEPVTDAATEPSPS